MNKMTGWKRCNGAIALLLLGNLCGGCQHLTICEAARSGNLAEVQRNIAEGIPPDTDCGDRDTALHIAASRDDANMARYLLQHGALANMQNNTAQTPLHVAADAGAIDVVEILLTNGGEVNRADSHGQTPLHLAAARGNVAIVKLLIERGAEVNARDEKQRTARKEAELNAKADVADYLKEHGGTE